MYYIWSFRNRAWWGPNHEGYVSDLRDAGKYSIVEAKNIAFNGLPGGAMPVDMQLAQQLQGLGAQEVEDKLDAWRRL